MTTIFSEHVLLEGGWAKNVRLKITKGTITEIHPSSAASPDDICVNTLLPALANLHSHSFQRAMAGMTEHRAAGRDSFWTWRTLMYRFVDRLTPEQIEAFACLVFMEVQEAGFASVGEFHYLHHQTGGQSYDTLSELTNRIFSAATVSGIGLTHLPVFYTYGGAGRTGLTGGQLRFGNDLDRYNRLVSEARETAKSLNSDTNVGIAPHSLRATSPENLQEVVAAHPDGPIHIHISEQLKEVAEIEAWLGQRPVAWLLENLAVDNRWCLIHATHMTKSETIGLAQSGAVAGLCPITEANLGDGPFNGATYLENGGAFGLGSDSNVHISLTQELRMLEYSQRLRDMARNVLVVGEGSVGETLYLGAALGGAQALGRNAGLIKIGATADLVAIDRNDPALCALNDDQLLDGLVFAANDNIVTDLWSAGRHQVQNGRHIERDQIVENYRKAIAQLLGDI